MFEYGRSVCLCNCHNLLYQHSNPCCADVGKLFTYKVTNPVYCPDDYVFILPLNEAG